MNVYYGMVLSGALALGSAAAHAQGEFDRDTQTGFYIGAGLTEVAIDGFDDQLDVDTDLDLDDTSWKAFAGWRFNEYFATELNYMDLGSEELEEGAARFELEAEAISAYAIGMVPVPYVDLYAKAGLAWWDAQGTSNIVPPSGVDNDFDEDETEFAWGAGIQARYRNFGARLEYESFDVADTDGLDLFSLGLTYTFKIAR